jgi:predicted NBD/HSP70 family sugar kinase
MGRNSIIVKPMDQIDYIDICCAAEENDELSREVILGAATAFGAGLANYINLLSPELVILCGPLIKHSTLFYQTSTEIALKKHYLRENARIRFSRGGYFKDSVIAAGAAAMVSEYALK